MSVVVTVITFTLVTSRWFTILYLELGETILR